MTLIKKFDVTLKQLKFIAKIEAPLIQKKFFFPIFSFTNPVNISFSKVFSRTLLLAKYDIKTICSFQFELIKEERLYPIFSFETKFNNHVIVDLEYFQKIYSYNKNIVDNILTLFKKFRIYCLANGLEVTDELFNNFLSVIDKNGVDING